MTFFIIVVILGVLGIILYNSVINSKNQVDNMFSGVDTALKMRYDLIPNIVSSVQEYMKHEQKILVELTELRASALNNNLSDNEKIELDQKTSSALGSIMVAVENYPDLKANDNVMQLQRSLNEVEAQISAARRSYNQAVTDYNNLREMFPTNLIAQNILGFQKKEVFSIEENERQNIKVKDLFNK